MREELKIFVDVRAVDADRLDFVDLRKQLLVLEGNRDKTEFVDLSVADFC